jgi:membrane associated rhomboid family serine protease
MAFRSYGAIGFPTLTPMVKYLVIACVIVFILQIGVGDPVIAQFGLVPYAVVHELAVWQPITYLFLHGGFWHLLFNMFALWMFGSELERYWGGRKFLGFYLFAGVGAGLLSVLVHPSSMIPTIGASGAIYGIFMAYGMMFPDRLVYLYFLIPVKVKYFVAVLGAIEFFSAFAASGTPIDHFAHLGGMAFGFVYMKGWVRPAAIRENYYRWRMKQMERRFRVHQGGRQGPPPDRKRKDNDFWIN